MNPTRPLLVLGVLVATSGTAAADDGLRLGNPQPAVALGIGATTGMSSIASGAGLHLEALARIFPETLGGIEFDAMLVGTDHPDLPRAAGRSLRAGGKLRQSLMGWGALSLGGELAAVLGVGWERIDWNQGGRLRRTSFAIGVEDGLALHRHQGGRDRYAGLTVGVRGIFSRANPDCDGPCMPALTGWSGGLMVDLIIRASP